MTGASGLIPTGAAPQQRIDPMEILRSLGWGQSSGGGGMQTIDRSPEIRGRYKEMRDRAAGRHDFAGKQLGQMYGQLQGAYKDLPEIAQQRFQIAQEAGTEQSARLIEAATSRINEEAASRAAQAAELGIEPMEMSKLNEEADYQSGQIGQTAANWGGMMGALSASEQTRGQVAYEGALGMETWAKQDLLTRYQNYLSMLDEAESQELMGAIQMIAGGGGGGGSASRIPSGIVEALMMESFYQNGILQDPRLASTPEEQTFIERKNSTYKYFGVTDRDISLIQGIIMNGGSYQQYLAEGGNALGVEAAKELGIVIPAWFYEPSGSSRSGRR